MGWLGWQSSGQTNFPVEKKHNGELIWSTFYYSLTYLISFQVQNKKYGKNIEKGRK